MTKTSKLALKLLMMIGGLGLVSLAELQKAGLAQQQQGGLNVIESNGFKFNSTTNIYSLLPANEWYAGESLQLILQNPLYAAPATSISVQSSAIRENLPYSNIQILTYGGSYAQPPNDVAYFQPAGINASFDAHIAIDINPEKTSGVSLPLMSNGVTANGDAITPQYPWGNGELYIPQFGIALLTFGTPGYYADGNGLSNNDQGGNGGDITASITRSKIQINGSNKTSDASGKGYAWEQLGGGILLASVGGHGGASSSGSGNLTGGDGDAIFLEISDTLIELNNLQGNAQAPYSGIAAISQGGQGGACCVWNLQNGDVQIGESVLYRPEMAKNQYYQGSFPGLYNKKDPNPGSMIANGYAGNGTTTGGNGNGSPVSVEVSNTIIKGDGSYLRGVVAGSVGGSTEYSPLLPGAGTWSNTTLYPYYTVAVIPSKNNYAFLLPGSSDNVEVTLNQGTIIDLKGENLIGVAALSTTAPYIIPTNIQNFQDYTTMIGNVRVLIDESSKIRVDGSNKGHSIGLLAVSAGSFGVNPFIKQDNSAAWYLGAGQAGEVSVDNKGTITVQGETSIGLAAISSSNSGGISQAGTSSSNGASFLNGRSERVDVDHSGTISTNGETAIGIYAGSTGSGGMAFDITDNNNEPTYINGSNLTPSIRTFTSSDGGNTITEGNVSINTLTTNDAENVTVDIAKNASIIVGNQNETKTAFGVIAQSIGSGGGITTGGSAALIGDGENGSTGGNGGAVKLNNHGSIQVKGEKVVGILAQSIGGGGGAGASKTGLFTATGGAGGLGGDGGAIHLNFDRGSQLITEGDFATGLIAHSIGGGGGYGGMSTAVGPFYSRAHGGQGGPGGDGGNIAVSSSGAKIRTIGDHSQAVLLQSIGGGGGVGGSANSISAGMNLDIAIAIGGGGGVAGQGGTINSVDQDNNPAPFVMDTATNANDSAAIMLQSIGGGGGSAGSASAKAIAAAIPKLTTDYPVLAVGVGLGGSGGAGGDGGAINFWYEGQLATDGNNSHGVLAQSIGGGGGNGGDGTANAGPLPAIVDVLALNSLAFDDLTSPWHLKVAVGTGGNGGGGGNGGDVDITIGSSSSASASENGTTILTTGNNAIGAMAQSIGGGGGTAGVGSGVDIGYAGTFTNIAELINYADKIGVFYDYVNQLLGKSTNIALPTSEATFTVGSDTGDNGAGGNVAITLNKRIYTIGASSHALVAQSISGGGGRSISTGAGFFTSLNSMVTQVGGGSTVPNESHGGGNASIRNNGVIVTGFLYDTNNIMNNKREDFSSPAVMGSGSFGMFAQSIGGGGGEGGQFDPNSHVDSSLIYGLATGKINDEEAQNKLNISPQQWAEMRAGKTKISTNLEHTIESKNYYSTINVGGVGCTSAVEFNSVCGASAGKVELENNGTITTYGHNSIGVIGQSIGGGGGVGGAGSRNQILSDNANSSSAKSTNIAIAVGGMARTLNGNNIGSGGNIYYQSSTKNSSISTSGYGAHGILLQSVGGGGGLAIESSTLGFENDYGKWIINDNSELTFSPNNPSNATLLTENSQNELLAGTVSFGSVTMRDVEGMSKTAGGGSGGSGGAITIGTERQPALGNIVTYGDSANGVFTQTVGGGGGIASIGCTNRAGDSNSNASPCWSNNKTVNYPEESSEYVSGYGSSGAQVLVNPTRPDLVSVNEQGNGLNYVNTLPNGTGNIDILSGQNIQTYGNRSLGIVAQNIAAWGGYINTSKKLIQSVLVPSWGAPTDYIYSGETAINLIEGHVLTVGDGSWGVLAQSLRNGGGLFGDTALDIRYSGITESMSIPSLHTGARRSLNSVSVDLEDSSIRTHGRNAHGIVIQNIGNGGIIMEDDLMHFKSSSEGSTNNGITSLALTNSRVQTTGMGSRGVIINSQSVNGQYSITPITVSLNKASEISSQQATSLALIGGSGNEQTPNTVDVNNSVIKNAMFHQRPKASTNNKDIADNQWAIYAPVGYTNVTIGKGGKVIGNINLGGLSGTKGELTNLKGGSLEFASAIVADNSLHNHGRIHPYGDGAIGNSTIDGSLKHYKDGEIYIDIDKSTNDDIHDHLAVSGLAVISGEIIPKAGRLLPLSNKEVLSAGQMDWSGSARDSLVFDWEAEAKNNVLTLSIDSADFTPSGTTLTRNEQATGQYLQKLWDRSSSKQAPLFGYISNFAQDQGSDYANVLNQISGLPLNSQAIQMKTAFATSLTDSFGCPAVSDNGVSLNQTDCVWARWTGSVSDQSTKSNNAGYRASTGGVRLGAQKKLSEQWFAGFTFGYDNNNLTSSGFASQGDFIDASISAQKDINNWSFGTALGLAYGWFDNTRIPQLKGFRAAHSLDSQYTSESNALTMGLRLRGGYTFKQPNYFVKPFVDVDLLYTHIGGFSEWGQDSLALKANSSDQFNLAISPMMEFGADIGKINNRQIKAYVNAGATFLPGNTISTPMQFANGLASAGTYDLVTDGPSILGRLNLGLQAFVSEQLELRAQYGLQAGDGYSRQIITGSMTYRF